MSTQACAVCGRLTPERWDTPVTSDVAQYRCSSCGHAWTAPRRAKADLTEHLDKLNKRK